jgi:hypothetical protein
LLKVSTSREPATVRIRVFLEIVTFVEVIDSDLGTVLSVPSNSCDTGIGSRFDELPVFLDPTVTVVV